jgi:hypothetical protein
MIVALALVASCMFYPFLPGEYDGMAVTLSAMAQLFGMVGLLLVPLGAIWLAYELGRSAASAGSPPTKDLGSWFAWASIGAATLVAIAIALGAAIDNHFSLGLAVIAVWAYCAMRLAAKSRELHNVANRTFNPSPIYLVVLPIAAAIFTFMFVGPASESCRNRAIDDSARLIRDIERYRDAHGHYPRSLESLWDDYRPSVVCIDRYRYEPNGDLYNVYFEHFSTALDIKEIVMYNKGGQHEFTSHNADLLQLPASELAVRRGYISVHHAARPDWKYFLFD